VCVYGRGCVHSKKNQEISVLKSVNSFTKRAQKLTCLELRNIAVNIKIRYLGGTTKYVFGLNIKIDKKEKFELKIIYINT